MYLLKPSFTGGELSPALYGRTDIAKYDIGAAELLNFLVLRYGGIANRPGTRYIGGTSNNKKAVLLPFRYSSSQNFIIEITAGHIRFYTNQKPVLTSAGAAYEIANTYTEDELETIKYTQSADVVFLVQPNHPPMCLTRYANNNWTFEKMDITDGPFDDGNVKELMLTPSDTQGNITLIASADYFEESMIGCKLKIGSTIASQYKKGLPVSENITIIDTVSNTGTHSLKTAPDGYVLINHKVTNAKFGILAGYNYDAASNTLYLDSAQASGLASMLYNVSEFKIVREYLKENSLYIDCVPGGTVYVESFGFWNGNFQLEEYIDGAWSAIRSQTGNRSQNYNFTHTNNSSEIRSYRITSTEFDISTWSGENEKQRGYVTIQAFAQDYYGIVKITAITSSTQATATVIKKLGATKATKDFAVSAWSSAKGYPACAGFFEDRLVFAGSKTKPQTFWMSKTGDYWNFGTSIPQVDNDAITGTLNGGQMNGIKALIAFGELIMLTAGGEHKVTGNGKALSPTNMVSQAQEYRGISDILPVTVGSRIVYIQEQGSIIRDLAYSYEADKYTGDDINLLASHLFDGHEIVSMTYQQTPNSIVWCVRDDGLLLGMTYLKEQDVYAWHQHSTDGEYISVCSISGADEDELWCVVKRGDNYFVELMAERDSSKEPAQQFFVDCGVTYNGEATTEITGLSHLEGKTVSILADGNVVPQQIVAGGKITLSRAFSVVHVGLPITAQAQTMPLEFQAQDGTFQSRKKRVAQLMIMFKDSSGGVYGVNPEKLEEIKWRSTEAWGAPIKLYTGKKKLVVPQSGWEDTVKVIIRQTQPLPLTILSIVPEIEAGG